jgi:nucleoside-diphosphate-sugar epimerase
MHVLIAGCGWLGSALGRALVARGDRVTGVRRTPSAGTVLRALGIEPLFLDLADVRSVAAVPDDAKAIVACQAAKADSGNAYHAAYVEATRNLLLAARRLRVRSFVYTSSTGVFGQTDGSDVDETTPPAPSGPAAQVLVEAEQTVLDAARSGVRACVVRLSGLYGPGRTGAFERVRTLVLGRGEGDDTWMNWCHLDDAVATVMAALDRGRPGAIYHATDAHPARRREVVEWIASRLDTEEGRSPAVGTPLARPRGGAHRRILGERTRRELGLSLSRPSFRDGFAPLFPEVRG